LHERAVVGEGDATPHQAGIESQHVLVMLFPLFPRSFRIGLNVGNGEVEDDRVGFSCSMPVVS